MGFWETILDPLSRSVTESLELHFSSQRKQELMCLHLGTWRLSEENRHTVDPALESSSHDEPVNFTM